MQLEGFARKLDIAVAAGIVDRETSEVVEVGDGRWEVRASGPGQRNMKQGLGRRSLSYPLVVLSIQRLRDRMPLVVFILLLVLLLMLVGIACACATEHPMKAVDRTVSATSAMPALIEVWTYTFAAILLAVFIVPQRRRALGRASPQELQRFLF